MTDRTTDRDDAPPMALLCGGAAELGLDLNARQVRQFESYYLELAAWNQRVNLTSVTGYEEVQVKHFLDSLSVLQALPAGLPPGARLADVGAGAGFPGLPLKLAFPDIHLSLMESTGKKTRFLAHLVEVLGLSGVEVLIGRAEELAHRSELRESFHLVVSRGVARLPILLEYTLPFCRQGGRAALPRRGEVDREAADASKALDVLGGRVSGIHPVSVTGLDDGRVVLLLEKVGPTPDQYPRRPGIPAKRPL